MEVIGRISLFSALYATHKASQDHENAAPNITILTNASYLISWCDADMAPFHAPESLNGRLNQTSRFRHSVTHIVWFVLYFKASFHSVGFFNVFRALPCPLTQHVVPASVASSCGSRGPPLCQLYITGALALAASGCSCAGDATEGLQPGKPFRRRWR